MNPTVRSLALLLLPLSVLSGCGGHSNPVWPVAPVETARDVYAVGARGRIYHYDGSVWTAMESGITDSTITLHDIWGTSSTDVYAVGSRGTLLHFDGGSWSRVANSATFTFEGICGDWLGVFAVGLGDTTLHRDGLGNWQAVPTGTGPGTVLWAVGPALGLMFDLTDVYAVGDVGGRGTILHWENARWYADATTWPSVLHSVWGFKRVEVFAVGDNGTILHNLGDSWAPMRSGTTADLRRVWGSTTRDAFATGAGGTILHYDGSSWSPMESGSTASLVGIWGRSGSDVFVVGPGEQILHYDGHSWSRMGTGGADSLLAVWGPE